MSQQPREITELGRQAREMTIKKVVDKLVIYQSDAGYSDVQKAKMKRD